MKLPMFTSFLAATAIATSAAFPPSNAGAKSLSSSELSSLRAQSRSEFETLRAGKIERQAPVGAAERARLQQAQAQSPKLDAVARRRHHQR